MKSQMAIKEFAKFSGVSPTTLRYWDEIGLFSPGYRDTSNNYRYYTPDQIIALDFIKVLSQVGTPLKTIKDMANDRSPETTLGLINQQERRLDRKMRELVETHSIIHTRRELISQGLLAEEKGLGITTMELGETLFALGPRNQPRDSGSFYESFAEFCDHANHAQINLNLPIGGRYDNIGSFTETPLVPDHYYVLDSAGGQKRPAGRYLVGWQRGYYGDFGNFPERLAKYIKEYELSPTGPLYVIYALDETCINDPKNYLAQICVRLPD
ncbi:MerR family transcriptional regulator [Candidatus Saccharibacteria bacterium]|nr:MerR family transcriptional regulator [Candidatus Saccharibacteria bacterium]